MAGTATRGALEVEGAGRPRDASGFVHAFANLLKTMIGSGIFVLPWVTARAGLGLSLVGLAVMAFFTQAAIRLVVRCAVHERVLERARAYGDLDRASPSPRAGGGDSHGSSSWKLVSTAAFGGAGWAVSCGSLLAAQLGVVSSYIDFVGNTLMLSFGLSVGASRLLLWLVLSGLSMLRPLRSVAFVSMAGLGVYAYVFALIGFFGYQAPPREAPLVWADFGQLGAWFGPAIFAFEGMGTALSLFESMSHLTDAKPFFSVVSYSYAVAVVLYGAVAAVGYAAWGDGVAEVVLRSFPHTPLGQSASSLLALALVLTYPLQMTAVYQLSESWLKPTQAHLWPLVRAALVGLTALMATLIPNVEMMISLTGALAFSMIGFIMPGLIYLKLRPPTTEDAGDAAARGTPWSEVASAVVMVGLGLLAGGWGVYESLAQL